MSGQRAFEQKLADFVSENIEVIGSKHPRCVVYFVKRGRFIKIGKTRSFQARMRTLNGGTTTPPGFDDIELLAVVPDDWNHSKEGRLHRQFESIRAGGEWFHATSPLMAMIAAATTPDFKAHLARDVTRDVARMRKRYCDCAERGKRAERECPTCGHEPKYHDEGSCAVFDGDMRGCKCPGFEGLNPKCGQTLIAA